MPPSPLDLLTDAEALVLAGAGAAPLAINGAELATGPEATVVIVAAGDDPDGSGVRDDQSLTLVGPLPRSAVERPGPVHACVRLPEGVLYLGTAFLTGWTHGRSPDSFERCSLHLDEELTHETLDRVRPLSAPSHLPGLDWLEHVESDPARALRSFVTGWYACSEFAQETTAPRVPVPAALADFYELAHDRPDLFGGQNHLVRPSQLQVDEAGRTLIGYENQGCFTWALDPSGADPRVLTSWDDEEWTTENERLSGFLLQFALYEAVPAAPYDAMTDMVSPEEVRELTEGWRRVPLEPFLGSTLFYVAPGLVAQVPAPSEDADAGNVWIGAAHRSLLRPLAGLDVEWLSIDA